MAETIEDSTLPTSPRQARRLLSRIREEEQRKEENIPEEAKEELQGLREVTRDTLDNPLHVLPELLQNADDIGGDCSKVTIELSEDALIFRNHQEPMTYENVEALGAFTKSTKQGDFDSIGYFGIGFKTVFSLTDTPYIHSGYFSFRYETDAPTTPVDVEYEEQPATDGERFDGTTIVLPFTDEAKVDRRDNVERQLENLGSLLPFLNNIKTIDVYEYDQKRIYRREDTDQGGVRVVHEEDGEETVIERLRLFSDSFRPENDLLEQLAEKRHLDAETLRDRNPELEITIAVRIDNSGVPTARDGPLSGANLRRESHLFCHFPTDADTRLPFDIQADFSLRPDREKIAWPDAFNKELLNHVPSLFEDAFVQFHQERVTPSRILELIPDPTLERPSYLEPVVEEILSFVRAESCVPDQNKNLFQPDEVVFLQQPFRDLLSERELGEILDRKVRYPSDEISEKARARLRAIVDDSVVGVEELLENAIDPSLYETRRNAWLVRFFAGINQYWRSEYQPGLGSLDVELRKARDAFEESLKQVPLLPIDDAGVTSYTTVEGEVYRLQQGYTDDYELFTDTDQLNLLSENFLSKLANPDDRLQDVAGSAESFLFDDEPFSIPTLEAKDVVRDVINPAFESDTIEPDRADRYILFVSKRARTLADEADIKLQVRESEDSTGEFYSPESLYLGNEYIDTFDSDTLFRPFGDLEPVSEHYLELGEQSRTEWTNALAALGVTRRIEVCEQDPWDSDRFKSQEDAEEFLRQHGGLEETELHDERTLSGYNGQPRKWRWMKRDKRHGQIQNYKYAFIDRYLPEESKRVLEKHTDDGAEPDSVDFWREFIQMLDAEWESYYQDKIYRVYRYSEYKNRYRVKTGECACPTSFGLFLQNSAWCPGSDGNVHHPNKLFVKNEQTKNKSVTFVEPQPNSKELIDFLDLQRYPGIQVSVIALRETVEKYRRDDENNDADQNEIERAIRSDLWAISRELDNEPATLESHELEALERLEQIPFIYVANATPAFRDPSQVTWEGASLGEYSVPIGDIYPDFESLLVEELGVSREPTIQDCFSFLNTVNLTTTSEANTETANWPDTLTAWSRILDEAVYISEDQINTSNDPLEQARDSLKANSQIPTAARTLQDWKDVHYHTTDEILLSNLPKEIKSGILHPERDERYSSEKYRQRLERLTGTDSLEKSLDVDILTNISPDDLIGPLYAEHPRLFDAAYSYLENSVTASDTELLHKLADAPVYKVDKLSCRYTVGVEYEAMTDDINCFIDTNSQGRQILLTSAERAGFELVDALVQELGLNKTAGEELTAILKGSFGKPESLLQAYIEDDGYEYIPFTHTVSDDDLSEQPETPDTSDGDSEENRSTNITEPEDGEESSSTEETDTKTASGVQTRSSPTVGNRPIDNESSDSAEEKQQEQASDSGIAVSKGNDASESSNENGDNNSSSSSLTSGLGDLTISGNNSGGGGGSEQLESGNEGEAFVLEELREVVESYFREKDGFEDTLTNSSGDKYTVQGEIHGDHREVYVEDVSQQKLGYDIRLQGASLVNNQSTLSLKSIDEDETTYVEVKSTKGESREFSLSPNEYLTAIRDPTDYVIVRVHTVLTEAKIDRIFYTLPEFYEQINNAALYPNGIKIEYNSEP